MLNMHLNFTCFVAKFSKPQMEKRRRERINHNLETLRLLMLENTADEVYNDYTLLEYIAHAVVLPWTHAFCCIVIILYRT